MSGELLTAESRMSAFAGSFPSAVNAPGVQLWDANSLDRWATETPISTGELHTAQVLLAVWDPYHRWRCGSFDLIGAIRVWDPAHREAFLQWAEDPWWP